MTFFSIKVKDYHWEDGFFPEPDFSYLLGSESFNRWFQKSEIRERLVSKDCGSTMWLQKSEIRFHEKSGNVSFRLWFHKIPRERCLCLWNDCEETLKTKISPKRVHLRLCGVQWAQCGMTRRRQYFQICYLDLHWQAAKDLWIVIVFILQGKSGFHVLVQSTYRWISMFNLNICIVQNNVKIYS